MLLPGLLIGATDLLVPQVERFSVVHYFHALQPAANPPGHLQASEANY